MLRERVFAPLTLTACWVVVFFFASEEDLARPLTAEEDEGAGAKA